MLLSEKETSCSLLYKRTSRYCNLSLNDGHIGIGGIIVERIGTQRKEKKEREKKKFGKISARARNRALIKSRSARGIKGRPMELEIHCMQITRRGIYFFLYIRVIPLLLAIASFPLCLPLSFLPVKPSSQPQISCSRAPTERKLKEDPPPLLSFSATPCF